MKVRHSHPFCRLRAGSSGNPVFSKYYLTRVLIEYKRLIGLQIENWAYKRLTCLKGDYGFYSISTKFGIFPNPTGKSKERGTNIKIRIADIKNNILFVYE